MATDPPGALNTKAPPATRMALAITLLAWWGTFATLLWVCFLRAGPHSLATTVNWFMLPHPLTAVLALTLIAAGVLLRQRGPGSGRRIGSANLVAGILLGTPHVWALTLLVALP